MTGRDILHTNGDPRSGSGTCGALSIGELNELDEDRHSVIQDCRALSSSSSGTVEIENPYENKSESRIAAACWVSNAWEAK